MPLVAGIEIENFRCFQKLSVEGLTRVNLFIGTNNSGKTALLEAVEALVSEASPFLLYRASLERGEGRPRREWGPSDLEGNIDIDVRHWFHGHKLTEGACFSVRETGGRERSVSRAIERVPADAASPPFVPGGLQIGLRRPGMLESRVTLGLPLQPDGSLGAGDPSRWLAHGTLLAPPVCFMTTQRPRPTELSRLWDSIVLTPREQSTIAALRLIEPKIDRVATSRNGDAVQVLLAGAAGPVPLGTLGEGVTRMLAIALQLVCAQGGFLLIDELEIGFHWSVMPRVWRFLVQSARELGVQVFASTHSKDCLEAIAELHGAEPDLAADVTVHRLEEGRPEAIRIAPRILGLAIDGGQEVR